MKSEVKGAATSKRLGNTGTDLPEDGLIHIETCKRNISDN
jgi:hypothetical protein